MAEQFQVLSALLRAELRGAAVSRELVEGFGDEEFAGLYRLAKSHDLAHIAADALRRAGIEVTGRAREGFDMQLLLAEKRYCDQQYELEQIGSLFEKEGIDYLPLKGAVLREMYPRPEMRTSSDLDILIRPAELDRASALLRERLEYEYRGKAEHDAQFYTPGGTHIELHFALVEDYREFDRVMKNVWESAAPAEGEKHRYLMSWEYFYAYMIAHMAKHFINGGCGIRTFLDIWVFRQRQAYDDRAVQSLLEKNRLSGFCRASEKLAEVWFGDAEHDDTTREMERYLVGAGVYGTLENRIISDRTRHKKGRLAYLAERCFMPYRKMKNRYTVLKKHPYLLPLFWVVRWFDTIRAGRTKTVISSIKSNSNLSQEELERISRLYDELDMRI